MTHITYPQFSQMDIRVGTIKEASEVPDADKLLLCQVDFGEVDDEGNKTLRQIVSGIKEFYPDPQELVGKQALYIINLEPRKIRGVESHGMLLAAEDEDGEPVFLIPEEPVKAGTKIG